MILSHGNFLRSSLMMMALSTPLQLLAMGSPSLSSEKDPTCTAALPNYQLDLRKASISKAVDNPIINHQPYEAAFNKDIDSPYAGSNHESTHAFSGTLALTGSNDYSGCATYTAGILPPNIHGRSNKVPTFLNSGHLTLHTYEGWNSETPIFLEPEATLTLPGGHIIYSGVPRSDATPTVVSSEMLIIDNYEQLSDLAPICIRTGAAITLPGGLVIHGDSSTSESHSTD